jgi:oligopeptide/dipeptide ABC transporter ATP-binding protein
VNVGAGDLEPILAARGVTVRFPDEDGGYVYAVDDVSFDLRRGEVLAIVGESGCGKSTLASSIPRLVPHPGEVTEGRIVFDGADLLELPPARLRAIRGHDIAMVFQEPMASLNPVLTVGYQVSEVLRRHLRLPAGVARQRVLELLRLVGIPAPEQRIHEYPHQMSGGMAQRVMIATAIACNPRVLIADEPTTALDVTIQAGILRLLLGLRERLGMAIMLITHDLGVVAEAADRVMVMYAGRSVETASVQDLFASTQHPYTIGLLGAARRPRQARQPGDRAGRLHEIAGHVPTRRAPADQCVFAPRCPRADQRCRTELPVLEPKLVGHLAACFHPGPGP